MAVVFDFIPPSKDWQKYKEIRLETLKMEPDAFSSKYSDVAGYSDEYWKGLIEDENNIFLLALHENEVIGVIRATFNAPDESPSTAVLGGFYVRKEFRNKGVGRLLLGTVIDHIKNNNAIKEVRLYVKPQQTSAIALYNSVGFKKTGSKDFEDVMVLGI